MATQPPYLRIADELRRRIEAGELVPGDRVPSTRALAADCGVALATAGKALSELRRTGVVRTQSRVGTVVAPPARASRPTRSPTTTSTRSRPTTAPDRPSATPDRPSADSELTQTRIVRAAVELADAQGLEALTMRAVAASLGVATMAPYRHVAGKDELLLLMADAAYAEGRYPEIRPGGWRAQLEVGARVLWQLYRRHPWLAQLGPLARPLLLPNLLRHGEWVLRALSGLGLPPARVLDLQILLYNHGQGLAVNLEREALAQADTGMSDEQWVDDQVPTLTALARSGLFPHFAALLAGLEGGYDFDLDTLFETSLRALLDGFDQLIRREGRVYEAG